jgi:hypothetical protein
MTDRSEFEYADHGLAEPVNEAESAIFQMFVHYRMVPVEQRNSVRAHLDLLSTEDGVRMGYQVMAAATRKWIKRLGKSPA